MIYGVLFKFFLVEMDMAELLLLHLSERNGDFSFFLVKKKQFWLLGC